jgi:hypothetical protein
MAVLELLGLGLLKALAGASRAPKTAAELKAKTGSRELSPAQREPETCPGLWGPELRLELHLVLPASMAAA